MDAITSRAAAAPDAVLARNAASDATAAGDKRGLNRAAMMKLLLEMGRLQDETVRLRARVQELESLADTDPLTDVLNRRAFMRELERLIAQVDRYGGELSLVYFDIDDLKGLNDRLGHEAGDAAIAHVAHTLKRNTRASDLIGRMGGDEFVVALVYAAGAAAQARGADLSTAISETPLKLEGAAVTVRCAWGAHGLRSNDDARSAVAAADAAMYAVKHAA